MLKEAKQKARSLVNTYEFKFRRRYNLPETDPRFLAATQQEMITDYWAHWYFEHPKEMETELPDDDFDMDDILQKIESGDDSWEDI